MLQKIETYKLCNWMFLRKTHVWSDSFFCLQVSSIHHQRTRYFLMQCSSFVLKSEMVELYAHPSQISSSIVSHVKRSMQKNNGTPEPGMSKKKHTSVFVLLISIWSIIMESGIQDPATFKLILTNFNQLFILSALELSECTLFGHVPCCMD